MLDGPLHSTPHALMTRQFCTEFLMNLATCIILGLCTCPWSLTFDFYTFMNGTFFNSAICRSYRHFRCLHFSTNQTFESVWESAHPQCHYFKMKFHLHIYFPYHNTDFVLLCNVCMWCVGSWRQATTFDYSFEDYIRYFVLGLLLRLGTR